MSVGSTSGAVAVSLLALLSAVGCDSSGSLDSRSLACTTLPGEGQLQPLEVGNTWIYNRIDRDGGVTLTFRVEVVDKLLVDSAEQSYGYLLATNPPDESLEIVANTEAGLSNLGLVTEADTILSHGVTYPYPAEVGESFTEPVLTIDPETGSVTPTGEIRHRVVATEHSSSVGDTTFSTIVYRRDGLKLGDAMGLDVYSHYAPGIGLVLREWGGFSGDPQSQPISSMELVDYCLMR